MNPAGSNPLADTDQSVFFSRPVFQDTGPLGIKQVKWQGKGVLAVFKKLF